jgi:hypothetical protein
MHPGIITISPNIKISKYQKNLKYQNIDMVYKTPHKLSYLKSSWWSEPFSGNLKLSILSRASKSFRKSAI